MHGIMGRVIVKYRHGSCWQDALGCISCLSQTSRTSHCILMQRNYCEIIITIYGVPKVKTEVGSWLKSSYVIFRVHLSEETSFMSCRQRPDDEFHEDNHEPISATLYQALFVIVFIIVVIIGRNVSNYVNQRYWFFADVATVGACIGGGIVAAAAIHALFIGTRVAANDIFFDITAIVTIAIMLYFAGITPETIGIVCEAFIVIASVAVVVILIIGGLLIGSNAIFGETRTSLF